MRFELTDRILAYKPGGSLRTVKALSLAEEYLQDHFPGRPIMPGVMMVETMVQACAWMVRLETDFAPSIVVLKEARKVNYIGMVHPGEVLTMDVRLLKLADGRARFQGEGHVAGERRVSGRLELEYFSLADEDPSMADVDDRIRLEMRRRFEIIHSVAASEEVEAGAR
jgi:3-hydroxyacyl-[acyl-carrier-protein] dehydratase